MKIGIVGSGELGLLLAETLCSEKHDVVLIDRNSENFEHLKDSLDLMTVEGSGSDISVLKNSGIPDADALLAVSGDEAVNMISCQFASKLGVKRTICRFYSKESFSPEDGLTPEFFGIWRTVSPSELCVHKILDILDNPVILEKIHFSNPDALMAVIEITPSSMIAGTRISDLSAELVGSVRFAALVRDNQFLIPHGDTLIVSGDKVYIAGHRDSVSAFIATVAPAERSSMQQRIIISGATNTGTMLAETLIRQGGYEVRLIERSRKKGEKFLDRLTASGIMVIQGNPTDEAVLQEAGISGAALFVGAAEEDEENILSSIVARHLGAKKVAALTTKPEYIRIVPAMSNIDCHVSMTLVAVNAILRMLETGTMRIDAKLQRFRAHLTEFKISAHSPLVGKKLMNCRIPSTAVFALLFRGKEVLTPSGTTVFREGDTVAAIVTPEGIRDLEPLFPEH